MACRIGMSTDPEKRIAHWKQVEGHTHHRILAKGLTYEEAQLREKQEATSRGCHYQLGGDYKRGRIWSVYHVWGGKIG